MKSDRPNIAWIMAHDLGYGDLGCYGQRFRRTPRLDRMAREGITKVPENPALKTYLNLGFLPVYVEPISPNVDEGSSVSWESNRSPIKLAAVRAQLTDEQWAYLDVYYAFLNKSRSDGRHVLPLVHSR